MALFSTTPSSVYAVVSAGRPVPSVLLSPYDPTLGFLICLPEAVKRGWSSAGVERCERAERRLPVSSAERDSLPPSSSEKVYFMRFPRVRPSYRETPEVWLKKALREARYSRFFRRWRGVRGRVYEEVAWKEPYEFAVFEAGDCAEDAVAELEGVFGAVVFFEVVGDRSELFDGAGDRDPLDVFERRVGFAV